MVIIERKRSDQAARQALFEILKYIPLSRQFHGIPIPSIRYFIVSKTWHELLVPFSEFRRVFETKTEGFKIEADASGTVQTIIGMPFGTSSLQMRNIEFVSR